MSEQPDWSGIVFVLFIIRCAFSCAATASGQSTANPCTQCPLLNVITNNSNLDQPVTQTTGTDSAGCETLTVTCTGTSATSDVILLWSLAGQDEGSSTDGAGTGSITRTLVCDSNSQLELTDTGFTGVVDTVECMSS